MSEVTGEQQQQGEQFDHFTVRGPEQARAQEAVRLGSTARPAAVTTLGPDRATRNNPNKMRSSTQRNQDTADTLPRLTR